jgi:hypothetical protein
LGYPKGAVHPKLVGDRSTAMVLARLLEIYEIVLLPFGENQRYDLVIESESGFIRVQCKTGRLRNGVIKFNACSITYHHPNRLPGQGVQASLSRSGDVFGIYCPETDKVSVVPVEEIGKNAGSLRVERALNNQAQRIRWAGDYEIGLKAPAQVVRIRRQRDEAEGEPVDPFSTLFDA